MTKLDRYLKLLPSVQDEHGFIDSRECDSLLFTGLVSCVPGVAVDIMAAFDPKSGTWHRRPIEKSCYPDHSKSTISRDMGIGLAWHCYVHDRKDIAEAVVKYALTHFGIMGKAINFKVLMGRCFIGPGLLSTFARISGKYKMLWYLPMDTPGAPVLESYQAHLQVLHKLLRHKLKGTDPKKDRILLKQAERSPLNPLFQVAIGNTEEAKRLLQQEKYWPSGRLPTSHDRKASWLLQRDPGSDWEPVSSLHQHSGGDYLFCMALCNGDI